MSTEHLLVVPEDVADGLEIIHPTVCITYLVYDVVVAYDCDVGFAETYDGMDFHFRHIDSDEDWPYADALEPGTYPIEVVTESYYSHEYGTWEYRTWLQVKEDQ